MLINLPTDNILKIISNFNNCSDVLSLYYFDIKIKNIIDINLNYIVKKLVNNNIFNYYQMAVILTSCNKKRSINDLIEIQLFISKNTKVAINKYANEFTNYNKDLKKLEVYYQLRVYNKFSHNNAMTIAINLNQEQIKNLLELIKKGFSLDDAYYAASYLVDEEKINKMFLVMNHGLTVRYATRAVYELNDDGIEKVYELIKKNISVDDAINAVIDLDDELIKVMINLFNKGIDADTARYAAHMTENQQNELIFLMNKGVVSDLALDIIEYFNQEQFIMINNLINIGINCDIACDLIQIGDETSINKIINLYNKGLDNEKINHLVNNFDIDEILKFCHLMNQGVSYNVSIDIIEMFEEHQINKLVDLVNQGITSEIAFDIISTVKCQ